MSAISDPKPESIRIGEVTHHWAESQKICTHYFPAIDSTNSKAKAEAFSEKSLSENLVLYLTDYQGAGKGRRANTWVSCASGSQLLSTWSFMINEAPHPTLSPMMGLALHRAAMSTWPFLNWNLKAPNDLYIDEKKVAGILLETVSQGNDHRLLLGLGFNVISTPPAITHATSLVSKLSAAVPLLAQDWIAFLERLLYEFSFSLQMSFEPMNTTSAQALLAALNRHPLLSEKYVSLDENANLETPSKKISWMDL